MKRKIVNVFLAVFLILAIPVAAEESSPTDDIVVKATDAVISQMSANLRMTQDQITAVRGIIADNIAQVRNLQQNLEDGVIDGKTMYNKRVQLQNDENQKLGTILSASQMKLWIEIENE